MRVPRPKLTVRRCLIGVALIALLLSRLTVDSSGDLRGVTFHLTCSSIAGVWWNGLMGRYEVGYWPDTWTGRKPVGFGYDPRKHEWVEYPLPQ
jgi:hypothetical protein